MISGEFLELLEELNNATTITGTLVLMRHLAAGTCWFLHVGTLTAEFHELRIWIRKHLQSLHLLGKSNARLLIISGGTINSSAQGFFCRDFNYFPHCEELFSSSWNYQRNYTPVAESSHKT